MVGGLLVRLRKQWRHFRLSPRALLEQHQQHRSSGEVDASVTKTELGEYTEENPYHLVFAFVEFYEQDDAARTAVQDALNEYMIPKISY